MFCGDPAHVGELRGLFEGGPGAGGSDGPGDAGFFKKAFRRGYERRVFRSNEDDMSALAEPERACDAGRGLRREAVAGLREKEERDVWMMIGGIGVTQL